MAISSVKARRSHNAQSDMGQLLVNYNNDRLYRTLGSAALGIKAGSSAIAKTTEPITILVNGVLVAIADNTDCATLSGTITAAEYNCWLISTADGSTLTATQGTAGASFAAVTIPAVPAGETAVGIVVATKSDGTFTGGTTALDAANTTVTYINIIGGFPKVIANGAGSAFSATV